MRISETSLMGMQQLSASLQATAHNIANMGTFSSDRSIKDYATKIWEIDPVHVTLPSEIRVENSAKTRKSKKK